MYLVVCFYVGSSGTPLQTLLMAIFILSLTTFIYYVLLQLNCNKREWIARRESKGVYHKLVKELEVEDLAAYSVFSFNNCFKSGVAYWFSSIIFTKT